MVVLILSKNIILNIFALLYLFYRIQKLVRYGESKYILSPFFRKEYIVLSDGLVNSKTNPTEGLPLFLYLSSKLDNVYYLILEDSEKYQELKKLKNVIPYKKDLFTKSTYISLKAKILLFSFEKPVMLNASAYTIFIQHGIASFRLNVFRDGYRKGFADKLVVSSSIEKNRLIRFTDYEEDDFEGVGLVRYSDYAWDLIHKEHKESQEKSILIFLTRKSIIDEGGTCFQIPILNRIKQIVEIVQNEISKNNQKIPIKLGIHHSFFQDKRLINHINNLKEELKIQIVTTDNLTKEIITSSLLVTDYSSLSFDFLRQEKPVIFFRASDKTGYINEPELMEGTKTLDKELFNCCHNEEKFASTINTYLQNDFELEAEYKQKAKHFFEYCNGLDRYYSLITEQLK